MSGRNPFPPRPRIGCTDDEIAGDVRERGRHGNDHRDSPGLAGAPGALPVMLRSVTAIGRFDPPRARPHEGMAGRFGRLRAVSTSAIRKRSQAAGENPSGGCNRGWCPVPTSPAYSPTRLPLPPRQAVATTRGPGMLRPERRPAALCRPGDGDHPFRMGQPTADRPEFRSEFPWPCEVVQGACAKGVSQE
jgi:hypothetical protein